MQIDSGDGWRSVASSVRNLPLAGVTVSLGYRQDELDRSRWKRSGSIPCLNGAKFSTVWRVPAAARSTL